MYSEADDNDSIETRLLKEKTLVISLRNNKVILADLKRKGIQSSHHICTDRQYEPPQGCRSILKHGDKCRFAFNDKQQNSQNTR